MQLGNRSKIWPKLPLPAERGDICIEHVLAVDPGPARDAMIERWCAAVWNASLASRPSIAAIARQHLGID